MSSKISISRPYSILFILVFMLALSFSALDVTPAHAAGVRYAKPTASGTGDCSSWANACTLQTALTGAISGDEIWAAAGTYKPTTDPYNQDATFQLKSGVALYGGFAGTETARSQRNPATNVTILSGEIGPWTSSYHVVTGANNANLDGFTITAGNASGGGGYETEFGGGMYNVSSSPTLTNVTFTNNSAYWNGGGMYNSYYSNPTLTNVTFSDNSATHVGGGGMYNSYSSPTLTNVTFSGNSTNMHGGGMYNEDSSPTLMNVTFTNNSTIYGSGGGMQNSSSSPILTNITFIGNTADVGGGMDNQNSSNPTLTNVTFSGNSADHGGGMSNYSSDPTLANVTFSSNTASVGGGMYNYYSSPTLTNITFSGNTASGNSDSDGGGGMYNYYSSPTLTNVTFSGNSANMHGGGMYNEDSSPTLMNVTFSGNSASSVGGGMQNSSSSPILTNITFIGNTADVGGGMDNQNSSNPTLTNVTFSGNSATYGGGMYNLGSSPTIRNTIFWGNTSPDGAQIFNSNSTPIASDSVVQGGCPAGSTCTNIITSDPLLGTLGDYGGSTQTIPLLPGSSAIDAGNGAYCPTHDQRGETRSTPNCDIGAYESQGFSLVISGGNNQSAAFNSGFVDPLSVTVAPLNAGEPVDGGQVTFTAPGSGASAVISGSPATISSGAASVAATANNTLGAYSVFASITGANPIGFSLENINSAVYTIFLPLILR